MGTASTATHFAGIDVSKDALDACLLGPEVTMIDPRTAIAAWVTQAGQIEPIQTVGGWLQ